jgi:hypothetical protein
VSLSRFNKGIVGSYPATKDQRSFRASRSAALAVLKHRMETLQAKYRRQAVQRRIDNQQSAAVAARLRRKEQDG